MAGDHERYQRPNNECQRAHQNRPFMGALEG
jgi:hypothetical protein